MKKITLIFLVFTMASFAHAQDSDKVVVKGSRSYQHSYRTSNGLTSTEIEYNGTIVFNDTDTDVESISRGGFLKISKKTFGTRRTVLLEGKSNGEIDRSYFVGHKPAPWEPEGAEWFADVLLEVIRSTGIGVETRVVRFYKKGGLNAVFDEIDHIDSDFIKGKYYSATVDIDGLSANQISQVIEEGAGDISSDFESSRFLISNSDLFLKSELTTSQVFKSTSEISSDFEQSRVLLHYIKRNDLTDGQKRLAIEATMEISSDFEQSRVLQTLVKETKLSSSDLELLTEVIPSISSDFEAARVLLAVIKYQTLTDEHITFIIKASNDISSDFEQSRVLTNLASQELSNENIKLIAEATENISSDFEKGRLLKAIVSKFEGGEDLSFIIEASENISSDFEQARLLTIIADQDNLSYANYKALVLASDNINSDFESKRVLSTLIKNTDFDKNRSMLMLDTIDEISSNFEKSNLLKALGPKLPDNEDVHDKFREVAKSLTSDHEYGSVMRSVDF